MADTALQSRVLRFGTFELDLAAGELRKNGRRVRLQEQPLQLLTALIEKPGEVVTREELKDKLWPGDTYVDFDRSLNTAASKLRDALGDSASSPRFIETLPRRGYRFLASVGAVGESTSHVTATPSPVSDNTADGRPRPDSDGSKRELARRLRLAWSVAGTAALAAVAVLLIHFSKPPTEANQGPLRKFDLTPPIPFAMWQQNHVAISREGEHIAITTWDTDGRLWVQDLSKQEAPRAIEGGQGAFEPFWSPSSDWIGFFTYGGDLRKVGTEGGLAVTLCQLPSNSSSGAAWSPDEKSIVFSSGDPAGLYEVAANGGMPEPIIPPEVSDEEDPVPEFAAGAIRHPHFLPPEAGNRVLVYTVESSGTYRLVLHDLDTGRREVLGRGQRPFYSPSGHIVYEGAGGTDEIWAVPFSLSTLKATGEAFPIAEKSRSPTIAADGALVYADGAYSARQLTWFDRDGRQTGEIGETQDRTSYAKLSPDEGRVAVSVVQSPKRDVRIWDLARGVENRVNTTPGSLRPVWSPDGEELAFTVNRGASNFDILLRRSDGSGEEELLANTPSGEFLNDWSRDGRYVLYELQKEAGKFDLWYLARKENASSWEPHPFLQGPSNERAGVFSPSGRYVAYVANDSSPDEYEVYVQAFPEGGRKTRVSRNGGRQPRWSRDGRELFYVEGTTLIAAPVISHHPTFALGPAKPLFENPAFRTGLFITQYDVSADGKRFVVAVPVEPDRPRKIRVVQNWFEEFRERQVGDE